MRKRVSFPVLLVLFFSCASKEKIPADILPKAKMQAVMWDMISAGEYLNGFILLGDSVDRKAETAKYYGKVFRVHDISAQQFDKSYEYYQRNPALMKAILDSLGKKQLVQPAPVILSADSVTKKVIQLEDKGPDSASKEVLQVK